MPLGVSPWPSAWGRWQHGCPRHLGGLASGALLGYFVPEGEPTTRAGDNLWNTLAVISVLIIAGSFALMALQLGQPIR